MTEVVAPDNDTASKRYGTVELGDGRHYMVARAGFGPRGTAIMDALDLMRAAATMRERGEAIRKLFALSLEPFYSPSRVSALIENDLFGMEHLDSLVGVILGNDIAEAELSKKNSWAGTSPTPTTS